MKKIVIGLIVALVLMSAVGIQSIPQAEASTYRTCKYITVYKTSVVRLIDGSYTHITRTVRQRVCEYKNQSLPSHAY